MYIGSFDCPTCGPVELSIPKVSTEEYAVSCSRCGRFLGTWAEIKDSFVLCPTSAGPAETDGGKIDVV